MMAVRYFRCLYCQRGGGLTESVANSILNSAFPIHQISVSSGWIVRPNHLPMFFTYPPLRRKRACNQVDGVTVSYNLESGGSASMSHGSVFNPPTGVVSFGGKLTCIGATSP